jgi:peroxiredoxin Q/BCP
VVLYFYPKADTPGCTTQACGLSEALPLMNKLGAVVIGISPDSTKAIAKFAAKFNLRFPLVGDEPAASGTPRIIDSYGCWGEKSMYGRKYFGVLRTTYIIDAAGVIYHRMDAVKVDTHAADVAAVLADLLAGKPAPVIAAAATGTLAAKPVKAMPVQEKPVKTTATKPAPKAAAKKASAKATPKANKKGGKKSVKKVVKKKGKKVAKQPGKKTVTKAAARPASPKAAFRRKR